MRLLICVNKQYLSERTGTEDGLDAAEFSCFCDHSDRNPEQRFFREDVFRQMRKIKLK